MPTEQTPHRDAQQNGNGVMPGKAQRERRGGGPPTPTRAAEEDHRVHRGGLVTCPGPGDGAACADGARVMPGKLCKDCRAIVGGRNARGLREALRALRPACFLGGHLMRQPSGLGAPGKALWQQMRDALPDGWAYDERELAILAAACRQADDLALLEKAIKRDGATATGSKGQRVVNPCVSEARQARVVLSRLLGEISLPVESAEKPQTAASRRAQRAADARWDQHRRRQGVVTDG